MVAKDQIALPTMDKTDRKAGFTLLEVLAVLAIISLMLGLALPHINLQKSPAATQSVAIRLIGELDNAAYLARRRGVMATSLIDIQNNTIRIAPQDLVFQIPNFIKLDTRSPPSCEPSGLRIVFYSDGKVCAPVLVLSTATSVLLITINPLTGAISLGN